MTSEAEAVSVYDTLAVRTRVGFTGPVGKQQGATMIMLNAQAIKCKKEDFEENRDIQFVQFLVVAAHTEGMISAPFKYNDQRKGASKPVTKPLTASTCDGGMQFWTWQRKGQDKGERHDDTTWTLYPGTTLKMCFRQEDVEKGVFGNGHLTQIPAFSLCEVQLVPKSSDPCAEGWGITVRSVSLSSLTPYSYISVLNKLPTSADNAKLYAMQVKDNANAMHRQVESDNLFFVQTICNIDAFTEYVAAKDIESKTNSSSAAARKQAAFVRLWNCIPGSPYCVDIAEDQLLAYTNSSTVESAMRLLEVCASVGCVSILVYTNEYRGRNEDYSPLCGVPLLDTDKLLSCVCPENLFGDDIFVLSSSVSQFSENAQALMMHVLPEQNNGISSVIQPSTDLILCETLDLCGRGVAIHFALADKTVLWKGFVNTSPVQMFCVGSSGNACPARRKWGTL